MKNILVTVLVLLTIPIALAFSGSNDDYKVNYAIDGIGLSEGSNIDYEVMSNLHYLPVGEFQNADYKVNLGPYYLIPSCIHDADINCDNCVDMDELIAYIVLWKLDPEGVGMDNVLDAILIWKANPDCI